MNMIARFYERKPRVLSKIANARTGQVAILDNRKLVIVTNELDENRRGCVNLNTGEYAKLDLNLEVVLQDFTPVQW